MTLKYVKKFRCSSGYSYFGLKIEVMASFTLATKVLPRPTEKDAGGAAEPTCKFWRRNKSSAPAGDRIKIHQMSKCF